MFLLVITNGSDVINTTSGMRNLNVVISIVLLLLVACSGNDITQVNKVAVSQSWPVETGKNVTINYTDSGLTKALVTAPSLARYASEEKNYTEMSKGINVKFLDNKGNVESFLTALYAIRYDKEKRMIARNKVVVMNTDGDTLRTEELLWNEATQRISTNKQVTITTKTEMMWGDGLESDVAFKNPKIYKLRGTISLNN